VPIALPISCAAALSLLVPAAFFLRGPVPERRLRLGFNYATVTAIVWSGLLPLGFMSLGALAAATSVLSIVVAIGASYAWRDERLLARVDERLGSARGRATGLQELRERLDAANASRSLEMMEIAAWPTRRLIAHGCPSEALSVLDQIAVDESSRITRTDRREAKLLRAHALLQLSRIEEAKALLERDRVETETSAHALLLRDLLHVCGKGRADDAQRPNLIWLPWNRALDRLVRAHVLAADGEEAQALDTLASLVGRPYGAATLDLAAAVPGPASHLAAMIDEPAAPYR